MTGFVDAEGYFSIEFSKDSKARFNFTPPSPATQGDVFPFKLGKRAGEV